MTQIKAVMILKESSAEYSAEINGFTATVSKDSVIIENGIKQHPRLLAIYGAAKLANVSDWILINAPAV